MKKIISLFSLTLAFSSSLSVVSCNKVINGEENIVKVELSAIKPQLDKIISDINLNQPEAYLPSFNYDDYDDWSDRLFAAMNIEIKKLGFKELWSSFFRMEIINKDSIDSQYWQEKPIIRITPLRSNKYYGGQYEFQLNCAKSEIDESDKNIKVASSNDSDSYIKFIMAFSTHGSSNPQETKVAYSNLVSDYLKRRNIYIGNVNNLKYIDYDLKLDEHKTNGTLNFTISNFNNSEVTFVFEIIADIEVV